MDGEVPTLAIVGTIVVLIMLVMTVVAYATLRDPELNVLFYTLMAGFGAGFFICLIRISDIIKARSKKDIVNPTMITFTTCPNYWVMKTDPTTQTVTCLNNGGGNRVFIKPAIKASLTSDTLNSVFPTSNGTDVTQNVSFNLSAENGLSNDKKCIDAANFAWSEARVKCPN